jgi:hypothetical protein
MTHIEKILYCLVVSFCWQPRIDKCPQFYQSIRCILSSQLPSLHIDHIAFINLKFSVLASLLCCTKNLDWMNVFFKYSTLEFNNCWVVLFCTLMNHNKVWFTKDQKCASYVSHKPFHIL